MKKKKRAAAARRRHPYERCLQHALARLEKAVAEKRECQEKLASLDKEIPYLEDIVHALTPPREEVPPSNEMKVASITIGKPRWPAGLAIPDHLKRFLEPIPETTTEPQSEDETLREPSGTPLLD